MAVCSSQLAEGKRLHHTEPPVSHFLPVLGSIRGRLGPIRPGIKGLFGAPESPACRPLSAPEIPPWEFRCDQRLCVRHGLAGPLCCVHLERIQNVTSSFPLLCHHTRHFGSSNFFPPGPQRTVAVGDVAPGREPPSAHHPSHPSPCSGPPREPHERLTRSSTADRAP